MARQSIKVQVADLGAAINQTLTLYHEDVNKGIDAAAKKATKNLAKKTRATAPTGARGSFKKSISSKLLKKTRFATTYVWYVKPPDHRLTHLLVKGHETRDGGRTREDPFLANAWGEVEPEYLKDIEEALKNGK